MYITFVELPLSTKTLLVLYPSMVSMITRGSSCGYLTPLASCSEKTMSIYQNSSGIVPFDAYLSVYLSIYLYTIHLLQ